MALLLDTQILVWIGNDDPRLSSRVISEVIDNISSRNFVSVVVACEFTELHRRSRFGDGPTLAELLRRLQADVLPLPGDCWKTVELLPNVHRDPVDRMLVAHAIHADLTVVSADRAIRDYPVKTLW